MNQCANCGVYNPTAYCPWCKALDNRSTPPWTERGERESLKAMFSDSNVIPLGSGTITRKPCYRCKRLKEQYSQIRDLCTFFQVLSGCLTLALVAALML